MITSGIISGVATTNIEESAKFYTDNLGFKIEHKIDAPDFKLYILENDYTKLDLIEGASFKPGFSTIRATVRNFTDSLEDMAGMGLKQIGDVVELDKMKMAAYTKDDGSYFILSYHKRANLI